VPISASEPLFSGPYAGNDVTTVFDYGFRVYDPAEVMVIRTSAAGAISVLAYPADYSVTGAGDDGGGTITLTGGALETGATLTLVPDIALSQERPFSTQASTTLQQLEAALDKLTSIARQLQEQADRSLRLPAGSAALADLPLPEAGQALVGNATGTGYENGPDITGIGDIPTLVSDAQAAAADAEASAAQTHLAPTKGSYIATGASAAFVLTGVYTYASSIDVYFGGDYVDPSFYTVTNNGVNTTVTFDEVTPAGVRVSYTALRQREIASLVQEPENITNPDSSTSLDVWRAVEPFADRDAFLAATITSHVDRVCWFDNDRLIKVVRDAAQTDGPIAQTDGTLWYPEYLITPEHFGANTTPGTTDMSAAFQAAVDFAGTFGEGGYLNDPSRSIHTGDLPYLLATTVELDPDNNDWLSFVGAGTTIYSTVATGPAIDLNKDLVLAGGDNRGMASITGVSFSDISFVYTGVQGTGEIAIRCGNCSNVRISNCAFASFYISLDWHRCSTPVVTGCRFTAAGRTSVAYAHIYAQGIYQTDTETGLVQQYKPGGGAHISDNEFLGVGGTDGDLLDYCLRINSIDGLYFSNNHVNFFGKSGLSLAPDGTQTSPEYNATILDVNITGANYFDGGMKANGLSGVRAIELTGSGRSGQKIQDITISGAKIRGGAATSGADISGQDYGIVISIADASGFVSAYGGIRGININGCNIGQQRINAIRMNGALSPKIPAITPIINGNTFFEGRTDGTTANTSYISLDSDGAVITSNVFLAEGVTPVDEAVSISAASYTASSVTLANNDFVDSVAITPYITNFDATTISTIGPNNLASGRVDDNWAYATNANGSYVTDPGGNITAYHKLTVDFLAASNLQETWTFPVTFGAAPTISATLSTVSLAGSGQGTNDAIRPRVYSENSTQCIVQIQKVDATSSFVTGDTATVMLVAHGRV